MINSIQELREYFFHEHFLRNLPEIIPDKQKEDIDVKTDVEH